MRVIIDIDSVSATASSALTAPSGDAVNGGAAMDSSAAPGNAPGGTDAGGPPQWLLDSVGKAIASAAVEEVAAGDAGALQDAGAGPS